MKIKDMPLASLALSLRACHASAVPNCKACPANDNTGDCMGEIMEEAAKRLAEQMMLQAKADAMEKELKKYKEI